MKACRNDSTHDIAEVIILSVLFFRTKEKVKTTIPTKKEMVKML
jgi:hypothetical protein